MRRRSNRAWVTTFLVMSLVGTAYSSYAEKPRANHFASEWKKGKKFEPDSELTLRLSAGTTVRLAAKSSVEVQGKIPMPTNISGLGPFADTARLLRGRLDVTVNPKLGSTNALLVYGPRRTTVMVSGGRASIVVTEKGIAVGFYEGKDAAVGIGATWKHIRSGEMLVVSQEHPDGFESPLPSAPTRVTVNRPVIAVPGTTDPSRADWQKASNVAGYRVVLRDVQTDRNRTVETAQAHCELTDLAAGKYELRVAALTDFGLDGALSEPAYVNVVGVELPPGGFFAAGKAFVEPGQQVKLTYVDGLEMTYDRASFYFNAVARTGLRNGQATTFHLRLPGTVERASLEIAPRSLQTQIDLLPTRARWPRDKVRIVVTLPKSIAQSHNVELRATVTVNTKPVELEWVRTENTMETVILGPPVYPGPWILRASVTDQHGFLLGHNFLEIASMAGQDEQDLPVEVHRSPPTVQINR